MTASANLGNALNKIMSSTKTEQVMQKKFSFPSLCTLCWSGTAKKLQACQKLAHQAMCLRCYLLPLPTPSYNRNIRMAFCLFQILIRVASLTVSMKTQIGRRIRWSSCWSWAHTAVNALFQQTPGTLQRLQLNFHNITTFLSSFFLPFAGAADLIKL